MDFSVDLENAFLMSHDKVLEASVVAVPHEKNSKNVPLFVLY